MNDVLDNIFKDIKLDKKQKEAVLAEDKYQIIIAGAGAGKTTTMAAKVKYLVEHQKKQPDKIVIISYTNKAVNELKERIIDEFKIDTNIYTFHKFGLEILKKIGITKKIIIDNSIILNNAFRFLTKDTQKLETIINYFAYYVDIPKITTKIGYEKYNKIKSNYDYITLLGKIDYSQMHEHVQNENEAKLANFFFLHNIKYQYKKAYPFYNKVNYEPLFTIEINDSTYYIEIINTIDKNIIKVIKMHDKFKTKLILVENDNIIDNIKNSFRNLNIKYVKRSTYDKFMIIKKITDTKQYQKFIDLINTCIHLYKMNGYIEKPNSLRDEKFIKIFEYFLNYYNQYMKDNNAIDFDDMVMLARKEIKNIKLEYEYIIVDEYQDISLERFKFLKDVSKNSNSNIIVVGDDWQSIFAFAGSDTDLFMDFKEKMHARELKITNTYRNSQELIDVAGAFIMKNQKQITKNLISPKHYDKPVKIYLYNNEYYLNKIKTLNDIVERILVSDAEANILLIGRYTFDIYGFIHKDYFKIEENVLKSLRFPQAKITFMTAHSSKGLGFPHVVIINGENSEYGFPSNKNDDPIFHMFKKEDTSYMYSEERRLFYVALTRTKNEVYIIAPIFKSSIFLHEIKKNKNVEIINKTGMRWINKEEKCPKCHNELYLNYYNQKEIIPLYCCSNDKNKCNYETNNLKLKRRIKRCHKCKKGYVIVKKIKNNYYYICTKCHQKKEIIIQSPLYFLS